ncbi:MAG: HEAT repeat domain-containing protein [Verrucomicrobiales bacterium]|nr:HEAT repeat domain-containing protein [Verrucomicrobiales bacterium]
MNRPFWIGAALVLGLLTAGVVQLTGRRSGPRTALPVALSSLNPSWPGRPNLERDAILAAGPKAVEPLLMALNAHSWRDWALWTRLRSWVPSSLHSYLPTPGNQSSERDAAIWMLGTLGPAASNAIPTLRRIAADRSAVDKRAAAIMALARIDLDRSPALSNAITLLSSAHQTERFYAAQRFGDLTNHPGLHPAMLLPALSDGDGEVRANMTISIAEFGPRAHAAIPQIQQLLSDPYRHVSAGAAYALLRIDPSLAETATQALVAALRRNADLSGLIAPAFFSAAGPRAQSAKPYLETLLRGGPGPMRRSQAALALWEITGIAEPQVLEQLVRLQDVSPEMLAALADIGPAASNAIPQLREISSPPQLREAAEAAIRRIQEGKSVSPPVASPQ